MRLDAFLFHRLACRFVSFYPIPFYLIPFHFVACRSILFMSFYLVALVSCFMHARAEWANNQAPAEDPWQKEYSLTIKTRKKYILRNRENDGDDSDR